MDFEILNVSEEDPDVHINNLIEKDGLNYFVDILKKLDKKKENSDKPLENEEVSYNYFQSYLTLYFCNIGSWENPYEKICNNCELIPYLARLINEYIIENEKLNIINYFIENIWPITESYDKKKVRIIFLYELSKHNSILNILSNVINDFFDDHLFNKFFNDKDITDMIYNQITPLASDLKIHTMIVSTFKNFLNNNSTRYFVVDYLNSLLDNCKNTFKIENISYKKDKLYSKIIFKKEVYTTYISYIILEYFVNHKGVGRHHMEKIKTDYILNKDDNRYGFITELFYSQTKLLEMSYYRLEKELKYRVKECDDYEDILEEMENDPYNPRNIIENVVIRQLHKLCQERITELKNLISCFSEDTLKTLNSYLVFWTATLKTEPHEFVDNVIENIIETKLVEKDYNVDPIFMKLSYNVLREDGLTNNPHIKCQFLNVLVEYSRIMISESLYDTQLYIDGDFKKILCELPKLIVYIKKCSSDGEVYDMTYTQYKIFYIINHIVFPFKRYCEDVFLSLENDKDLFKNVINLLIENFQYSLNEGLSSILKIAELEKNPMDSDEFNNSMLTHNKNADFYITCNYEFLQSISQLSYNYPNIFLCPEIRESFSQNVIYFLEKLIGENRKQYKVKNSTKINFRPVKILEKLRDILVNMCEFDEFIKSVAKDERSYNRRLIERLLSVLYVHSKVSNYEDNLLSKFNDEVLKIRKQLKEEEDKEIPEELCDPIMSTLIEDPIMLPSTQIIMDKGVIARHLLSDPHDPFNRDELTMEKLEEYNKQDDIVKKIDEFKSKIEKFKSE